MAAATGIRVLRTSAAGRRQRRTLPYMVLLDMEPAAGAAGVDYSRPNSPEFEEADSAGSAAGAVCDAGVRAGDCAGAGFCRSRRRTGRLVSRGASALALRMRGAAAGV